VSSAVDGLPMTSWAARGGPVGGFGPLSWPLWPVLAALQAPRGAKSTLGAVQGCQEHPKSGHERPKSGKERPKSTPRTAKSTPRAAKRNPREIQEQPKIGQERPKSDPDGPGMTQEET